MCEHYVLSSLGSLTEMKFEIMNWHYALFTLNRWSLVIVLVSLQACFLSVLCGYSIFCSRRNVSEPYYLLIIEILHFIAYIHSGDFYTSLILGPFSLDYHA